jgi:outer membrane lipoprotein carrier protein
MRLLSLTCIALWIFAVVSSPRSRAAADVARSLELHYHRVRTMEAAFLEKYTSGGNSLRAESGEVYFSRPDRMRWDYDVPEQKMFLVDGKNVWYYVPADHTASRAKIKQSDDLRTPLALLMGKVNLQKLCGGLRLADSAASDPEERPSQAGNTVLVCTPDKGDEDYFREALLEINTRDQLVRVAVRQAGDIETEFRFGDWKENLPLDEAKFHFEPPVGVAIVDDAALASEGQQRPQ